MIHYLSICHHSRGYFDDSPSLDNFDVHLFNEEDEEILLMVTLWMMESGRKTSCEES